MPEGSEEPPQHDVPYEYAFWKFVRRQGWTLFELWEMPDDHVEMQYLFYTMEAKFGITE